MKALVLWAETESKNLGVRALGDGTAHLLRRVVPDAQVAFQGYGPGDAPVRIGLPRTQIRRVLSPRGELVDWVRTFDIVVDTRAGDSFADIYGLRRLLTMSLMTEIVGRAKVPLVMGPQTIGPFRTRRGVMMAKRALAVSTGVMARDPNSAQQAALLGRPADVSSTDVVFALTGITRTVTRDVIVNPSGLLWHANGHVDAERYRSVVTELCRELIRAGRRVALMAHVLESPFADNLDDDVPVVRELAATLGGDVEVLIPENLTQARCLFASAHVVVGARMHACLNALSVGTPAVPLAYSWKFEPLLADLNWPYTVDLRGESDHLRDVLRIVEDPQLPSRVGTVRERADERLADAERFIARVLEIARTRKP